METIISQLDYVKNKVIIRFQNCLQDVNFHVYKVLIKLELNG